MSKDYMQLIELIDPSAEASCSGDPSVYANITWHTTAIPKATLDADYLPLMKLQKIVEIDKRTNELIAAGFAYDSQVFSLSLPAQVTWLGLVTMQAALTWPVSVSTIGSGDYSLAEADVLDFVGAGMATLQAHLGSGRALKVSTNAIVSVDDATDEAAIAAVVDGR